MVLPPPAWPGASTHESPGPRSSHRGDNQACNWKGVEGRERQLSPSRSLQVSLCSALHSWFRRRHVLAACVHCALVCSVSCLTDSLQELQTASCLCQRPLPPNNLPVLPNWKETSLCDWSMCPPATACPCCSKPLLKECLDHFPAGSLPGSDTATSCPFNDANKCQTLEQWGKRGGLSSASVSQARSVDTGDLSADRWWDSSGTVWFGTDPAEAPESVLGCLGLNWKLGNQLCGLSSEVCRIRLACRDQIKSPRWRCLGALECNSNSLSKSKPHTRTHPARVAASVVGLALSPSAHDTQSRCRLTGVCLRHHTRVWAEWPIMPGATCQREARRNHWKGARRALVSAQ